MLNILFVDDDPQYRELVPTYLKKQLGVDVTIAKSGNEAIQLLQQGNRFQLVVSDYKMADGNGGDLYDYLNSHHICSLFILFTNETIDFKLKERFQGTYFLKILPKTDLKNLASVVVTALTSWTPSKPLK